MGIEITGVVLAGGQSSRMGRNKALLTVGREKVIDTIISAMSEVAQDILISANDLNAYRELGKKIIEDQFPGQGPLSGIHAALQAANTPWIMVAACDMPFVSSDLFRFLVKTVAEVQISDTGESNCQAMIPIGDGRVQPLLGAYHISSLPALEESLKSGKLRMTDWLAQLRVQYITEEVLLHETGMEASRAFFNMNNPEDYTLAVQRQAKEEGELS
ncbi:NTP transferase domain-containing protein [Paenibacillus sp. HJL G12]|uniref:Probable molybdenum cofactor guanylyltransferase n=1 Tax=Paenibacillus dendrobii TaxID=2691084 RepID=A0A7X3IQS5_9BACL|nr:molybdenum cofactor guanylyltransferase [Paenibacillus dendrobii]MWV46532.1 NTP transferase domain-containing protein [Paenibacillus dendrobii]